MSIINDALKKTEEHLQKNTDKDNLAAPKPAGVKPFLLYILILLAGLALGNFIFNLLSHKVKTTREPKKVSDTAAAAINSLPKAGLPIPPPEEIKPLPASFILNGIFFSDNDGYALVNNQIVRENDYVDGAKVSSITANTVELDNAGKTITLSTRR
ncbi:MAG: hypothetical protein V1830_03190 [Candidatus Omnitrophota bacterium]